MIVGLITLFSVLFFGSAADYYFVDNLEKGVKEYVEDKAVRKEILTDLKDVEVLAKSFNKKRKGELKQLKEMNLNYEAKASDFNSFYDHLAEERRDFQSAVIDVRIKVLSKISDIEWEKIIALSNKTVENAKRKSAKKKEKDNFAKLEQSILTNLQEQKTQEKALASFNNLKNTFQNLEGELSQINTMQNTAITNKHLTKQELLKESEDLNKLRTTAFKALQQFHFEIKSVSDEANFVKIMKELNKLLH